MNLSDNEKRDVIKYLKANKPLPEKYRFLLFDDAREVELLWNGKTNEVTNTILPFQTIEHIDEPRSEEKINMQRSLFDTSGRQIKGWTNKLIWGDNKLILSSLKNGPLRKEIEAQGGLKLIYIDPPFDVGADFSIDIKIGDEKFTKKPSVIEEIAYRDTWGKGADSFVAMIYERLKLMYDLLAEDGSIYVHCDWRVSPHVKLVLDEIFGKDNFQREIIWDYENISGFKSAANNWIHAHETVLFYSKDKNFLFNKQFDKYSDEYLSKFNKIDEKGRKYWQWSKNIRRYLDDYLNKKGKAVGDVWHIKYENNMSSNRTDYPTQKPETLLERIIKSGSNENDLIADFFCGSGTTLAVAEKLGRKWIGSDLGRFSIHTSRKRLIDVQRELKKESKDFRAFEILNIGKYEREYFVNTNEDLREEEKRQQKEQKEREFVELIISAYKSQSVNSFNNFVGKKRDRLVAVGPVNVPVDQKFIDEAIKECKKKKITKFDVLGFDYEMGLDFSKLSKQGVDIQFKVIPREVFDRQAVEKGQVRFYDVAYIEVKPIIKGRGKIKELSVELKDFSVFYNQDNTGEIEEKLKSGGSKVVIEDGQVIKLYKNRDTNIIEKEVLTKRWTDWVDYWAVDFNFESKKEIVRLPKKTSQQKKLDGSKDAKQLEINDFEETWTGNYIFENEWQSFRMKKDRNLELESVYKQVPKGKLKVAIKVVDIFGNDTTKIIEVNI